MSRCPCCGTTATMIKPLGIQRDWRGDPALILYNCDGCHTTRSIPWAEAPLWLLAEAVEAERRRVA